MLPTLAPGQLVVTIPAVVPGVVRRGSIVVVDDPRAEGRGMVKRVVRLGPDEAWVEGDNPSSSTDSRMFGSVPRSSIRRVVVARLPGWPRPSGRDGSPGGHDHRSQGARPIGGGLG